MRELTIATPFAMEDLPANAMRWAVRIWFTLAATGHWIFVVYIVAAYYPPLALEGLSGLEGAGLPAGYRAGDILGNLAAAGHVLLAALVIGGGPLQLVPQLRDRYPTFHRILGRSYLIAAVISALGGLWMVWMRGTVGNTFNHLVISLDALLIMAFAGMAVRHAVARRIVAHRRWAMRLFMVSSAVWFFRVGLMGWVFSTGGIGIDFETFTGPAIVALGLAQFMLPLAMLEWYFRCQRQVSAAEQLAFAGTTGLLSIYMTLGIFAATMGMWVPRLVA